MTPPIDPPTETACRVCRRILNTHRTADGRITYLHPASGAPYRHEPDPVPAAHLDQVARCCDFCSTTGANTWIYTTADITMIASGPDIEVTNHYGTSWASCPLCADLISARDLVRLHAQALAVTGLARNDIAAVTARHMMAATLDALQPGRTLTLNGWTGTAPPLPPPLLPKVRDRLASLLDDANTLPALEQPPIRARIAAGLPISRLYAIDPLYTDIAIAAAPGLQAASIAALDVPAPYGLLTWAYPVDTDATIAMSWASDGDTIHIATHRALATTINGPQLQKLREQAGWLLPTGWATLHTDRGIDGDHPAAVLLATWLLIAHRLTDTVPASIDASIRKAYARTGRPAPEVRIVQLRPTSPAIPPTDLAAPAAQRTRRQSDYRWWVKPFIRNQPHGPGRALRKPVLVFPFVNGPRGKPVKASTTVRLLAQPKPRPQKAPGSAPGDGAAP